MNNRISAAWCNAENSCSGLPAIFNDWRAGPADSMLARDIHDPTPNAGYTTAGDPPKAKTSISLLPLWGVHICRVRPRSQNGKPQLDDVRNPRKSIAPRKRRNACKKIAASACCTSARGPKGLKLAQPRKAKRGTQQNTQRLTAWEVECG